MPAYNEGHHIYDNLKETSRVFRRSKRNFEIILVDDGSADNTYEEARRAANELGNIIPVDVKPNGGKGNALKEGFKRATGDYVIFLDADLDLNPEQVRYMFRLMRDNRSDVIIGSKHHPQSRLNYPILRKVFSRTYAVVLKALFDLPLRDTQTGLKIFRYDALGRVFPNVVCKRYAFDVELLVNAHQAGYKVVEAPIVLDYRRNMKWGRIGFRDVYRMGIDTLAIFYRMQLIRDCYRAQESKLKVRGVE